MKRSILTLAVAGTFMFSAYCSTVDAQTKPVKKETAAVVKTDKKSTSKAAKTEKKQAKDTKKGAKCAPKECSEKSCEHGDKGCDASCEK